jgi:hypothetical protein
VLRCTPTQSKPISAPTCRQSCSADLLLNALFGLWWADPLAALVMVPVIAREGIEALRGKSCADCVIPKENDGKLR